jgi:hypothetical protein
MFWFWLQRVLFIALFAGTASDKHIRFFLYLMRKKQCFARALGGLMWCHGHMPGLQRTAEVQH